MPARRLTFFISISHYSTLFLYTLKCHLYSLYFKSLHMLFQKITSLLFLSPLFISSALILIWLPPPITFAFLISSYLSPPSPIPHLPPATPLPTHRITEPQPTPKTPPPERFAVSKSHGLRRETNTYGESIARASKNLSAMAKNVAGACEGGMKMGGGGKGWW
jgi:hypothetical protein